MEKDSFELATGPAGVTGHCENTTQMAMETTSPPLREMHDRYDASRLNALRHGVLSVHTVLPWPDWFNRTAAHEIPDSPDKRHQYAHNY
jgi:hypothetical protein